MKRFGLALELGGGLLILVIINLIWFPRDPGFVATSPHPYLIVILLMATLYGSLGGIAAAVAGSVLTLAIAGGGNLFKPLSEGNVSVAIFSFFMAAVLVGQGVDFHRRIKQRAQELAEQRTRELEDLRREMTLLSASKDDLENRLVGEPVTMNALYAHAKALGEMDEQAIPGAVLELLARYIAADQTMFYLREGSQLILAASRGFPEAEGPDSLIPIKRSLESLAWLALSSGRPVTFNDLPGEQPEHGGPVDVMAAPVDTGGDGQGVVVVRRLPFERLNAASLRYLGLIADWAGSSLAHAAAFRHNQEQSMDDPLLPVAARNYFMRRLAEEVKRAKRYGLDLALVLVRSGNRTGDPASVADSLGKLVSAFRPVLRTTDVLGRGLDDTSLGIILTATSGERVTTVTSKLGAAAEEAYQLPGGKVAIAGVSLSLDHDSAEALYQDAERRLDVV